MKQAINIDREYRYNWQREVIVHGPMSESKRNGIEGMTANSRTDSLYVSEALVLTDVTRDG